jgi:hypothetical protein
VLVAVVIFAIVLASVRFGIRRAVARTESAASIAELRRQSLMSTAQELLVDVPAGTAIHGVAMEATSATATLTVVAYADGDARLLISNGPAITSGAQYAKVREAATAFVEAVGRHAGKPRGGKGALKPALPAFPALNETRTYALTANGPQLVIVPADVEQLGDQLIATFRAAEARRA